MRLFAEALTHATAASFGSSAAAGTAIFDVIRGLDPRVSERIVSLQHDVRHLGNRANHDHADDHALALTALQVGHKLAGWFHTTFHARGFKAPPFVFPSNPADATAALRAELEASRVEAAQAAAKPTSLEGTATELERPSAEARAYQ